MSELLDNQFDTQNENMEIKIVGFTQALVLEELEEKENNCYAKIF